MPKWEFIHFAYYPGDGHHLSVILPPGFDPSPLKALCPRGAEWKDGWDDRTRRLVPDAPPSYRVSKLQDCAWPVLLAMLTFLAANGWEVPVTRNKPGNSGEDEIMLRRAIPE